MNDIKSVSLKWGDRPAQSILFTVSFVIKPETNIPSEIQFRIYFSGFSVEKVPECVFWA